MIFNANFDEIFDDLFQLQNYTCTHFLKNSMKFSAMECCLHSAIIKEDCDQLLHILFIVWFVLSLFFDFWFIHICMPIQIPSQISLSLSFGFVFLYTFENNNFNSQMTTAIHLNTLSHQVYDIYAIKRLPIIIIFIVIVNFTFHSV